VWPASGLQATRRAAPGERAVSGLDGREPRRVCLPFARWPAADRAGWRTATRKGDFLLDGPGAALKPLTLHRHRCSYGRWLGFLERRGRLDPAASPDARASRAAVEAYIAELEALNAPQTVVVRLQSLSVVLRWLASRAGLGLAAAPRHPARSQGRTGAGQARAAPARRCALRPRHVAHGGGRGPGVVHRASGPSCTATG